MVKHLHPMRETWVWSLGWETPLEKEMATHSSIHAWRIPWTEEPSRLQSTGSQRVGHDWATSLSLPSSSLPSPPSLPSHPCPACHHVYLLLQTHSSWAGCTASPGVVILLHKQNCIHLAASGAAPKLDLVRCLFFDGRKDCQGRPWDSEESSQGTSWPETKRVARAQCHPTCLLSSFS